MIFEKTQGGLIPNAVPIGQLQQARSSFKGARVQRTVFSSRVKRGRLETQNFKFMKKLGVKKPAFLPDFGLEKRKAVLDKFFTSFGPDDLKSVLADDVSIFQAEEKTPLGKEGYTAFISNDIKPSIPNFSWSHATSGHKDDEGYSIVKIQVAGSHTGQPYRVPDSDLPPVDASSKRLSLPEQTVKVKVEDGLIKEVKFLAQSDLKLDIYQQLGGKVPASIS